MIQLINKTYSAQIIAPTKEPNPDKPAIVPNYWPKNGSTTADVIEKADALFEEKKYVEVYDLLNKLKYANNQEIKWRIARTLYKITVDLKPPVDTEMEILQEGYNLLCDDAIEGNNNPNVHKWFAVIVDAKNKRESLEKKIQGYSMVLKHLRIASDLNKNDVVSCFLLGRLCFEMANLSAVKRFISKILYSEPPICTYEEAFRHLSRAEELSGHLYITNAYLLARTCYKLKQYYRARYYFSMIFHLSPITEYDQKCLSKVRFHLHQLEKFKLGKGELFMDCSNVLRSTDFDG